MKAILTIAAVCIFLSLGATAWADQPYAYVATISMPGVGQEEVSLYILPDGSGPALTEAMVIGSGELVDATISFRLITALDAPIPNYPYEDVWLETNNDQQYFCPGGSCADGPSNVDGEMTFSGAFSGGGFHLGDTYVFVNGSPASYLLGIYSFDHPPVSISFNSPDINGDGIIGLADIGLFATDFYADTYNYRSDFQCDGVLGLVDLGIIAVALFNSNQ